MKRMTSLFAGALLCLAAASPAFALVVNGGFEDGLNGWAVFDANGDDLISPFTGVNSNNVHSGLAAFETGELAPVAPVLLAQEISGATAGEYVFSFWLQRDATSEPGDSFFFNAAVNGNSVLTIDDAANPLEAAPYQQFSFNFTNPDEFMGIAFDFSHTAAFWHLDDVSITAVGASVDEGSGVAASLLMIVIGAVAVLASRVRTQGATRLV
jgi:hypothetical protein